MLVSYNWLKDFLDLDGQDPYELAEEITRSGVEIPDRIHPMDGLKKLVVGHVLDCEGVEGTHLHLEDWYSSSEKCNGCFMGFDTI